MLEPQFKPITIEDREIIEKYLDINKYPNSEYSFGSFYAWQESLNMQYAIIEDCLCIIYFFKKRMIAYFPLGLRENFLKAFHALDAYFKKHGQELLFTSLSEPMIEILKEEGLHDKFEVGDMRKFYDYVYTREKLITLKGKKLNGKRNHYNFFVNNYDYKMVDINEENEEECREAIKNMIVPEERGGEEELKASIKMLDARKEMDLSAKALYVGNKPIGVIMGGNHHDTGLIHIAKNDLEYRGASVAMFKHYLEDNLKECEYINLMEDLGIEGLRKSKLAFRPDYFVEEFSYKYKG